MLHLLHSQSFNGCEFRKFRFIIVINLSKMFSKWTKSVELHEFGLVVFPILDRCHWFLIVVVNPGTYEAVMYVLDSLPGDRSVVTKNIKNYLAEEWKHTGVDIKENMYLRKNAVQLDVPVQNNGNDCGVHMLINVEKLFARYDIIVFYFCLQVSLIDA